MGKILTGENVKSRKLQLGNSRGTYGNWERKLEGGLALHARLKKSRADTRLAEKNYFLSQRCDILTDASSLNNLW